MAHINLCPLFQIKYSGSGLGNKVGEGLVWEITQLEGGGEVTGVERDCSWALLPPSGWNLSPGYKAISETSARTSPARFLHSCH